MSMKTIAQQRLKDRLAAGPMTNRELQLKFKYSGRSLKSQLGALLAKGEICRIIGGTSADRRRSLVRYALASTRPTVAPSIEPPKPTDFQSREEYLEAVIVQLAQALPAGNELREYLTDVLTASPQPA
jgi:hypothetical protein